MVESMIALVIITGVFLVLFKVSHLLTGKILVEHAAMRVARARAVGFNEFMRLKAARICIIPVAGERLWPAKDDPRKDISEVALAHVYMRTPDSVYADGLLEYENWAPDRLSISSRGGTRSSVRLKTDWMDLSGEAEVDSLPIYLGAGTR